MKILRSSLYVLFKLSSAFCGTSATAVCLDCDTSDGSPGSSSSSAKSFSAQLVRPTSETSMFSLLNMFIAVSHSTGLANVLALTAFYQSKSTLRRNDRRQAPVMPSHNRARDPTEPSGDGGRNRICRATEIGSIYVNVERLCSCARGPIKVRPGAHCSSWRAS